MLWAASAWSLLSQGTVGYNRKNTNGVRSLLFRLLPSTLEMDFFHNNSFLGPDILSQFVIWANHIHELENKLVLDVKEVQCKNFKLCKIQALGKICFRSVKLSSWQFFWCQKIIIPQSSSKWTTQSPQNSLMRPVQNRCIWEIKQPHFHPFG